MATANQLEIKFYRFFPSKHAKGIAFITCRLLLLCWWMSLQKRVIEENVKGHTLLGIATKQAEEKVLKFRSCTDGNSEKAKLEIEFHGNFCDFPLTLAPDLRFFRRSFSILAVCAPGTVPCLSSTETR